MTLKDTIKEFLASLFNDDAEEWRIEGKLSIDEVKELRAELLDISKGLELDSEEKIINSFTCIPEEYFDENAIAVGTIAMKLIDDEWSLIWKPNLDIVDDSIKSPYCDIIPVKIIVDDKRNTTVFTTVCRVYRLFKKGGRSKFKRRILVEGFCKEYLKSTGVFDKEAIYEELRSILSIMVDENTSNYKGKAQASLSTKYSEESKRIECFFDYNPEVLEHPGDTIVMLNYSTENFGSGAFPILADDLLKITSAYYMKIGTALSESPLDS